MTEMDAYKRLRGEFSLAIPDDYNFAFDLIDRRAAERPDMTCLIAVNRDASEIRPVGYGEMAANSARFGNLLLSLEGGSLRPVHSERCSTLVSDTTQRVRSTTYKYLYSYSVRVLVLGVLVRVSEHRLQ